MMGFRRGFKKMVRGGGAAKQGSRFWDVLFYMLLALAGAVLVYRLWGR
jgi:hypothetical protein